MRALLIHGGAGTISEADQAAYEAGLRAALELGYRALAQGARAAVLAAVAAMEDDPDAFNAGTGSAPTRDGTVECDAALMLSDGSAGAVACVTRTKNPILLADAVRRETPHVLMVGAGAEALLEHPIDNAALRTPRMARALARWRERAEQPTGSATVGAVALDDTGALAAATSTGGVLGQWPGRVGDAPILGAGTYASAHAAISCTGKGEAFLKAGTAKEVALRLELGEAPGRVLEQALAQVRGFGGAGGLICLTRGGQLAFGFDTPHLAYGYRTPEASEAQVGHEAGVTVLESR